MSLSIPLFMMTASDYTIAPFKRQIASLADATAAMPSKRRKYVTNNARATRSDESDEQTGSDANATGTSPTSSDCIVNIRDNVRESLGQECSDLLWTGEELYEFVTELAGEHPLEFFLELQKTEQSEHAHCDSEAVCPSEKATSQEKLLTELVELKNEEAKMLHTLLYKQVYRGWWQSGDSLRMQWDDVASELAQDSSLEKPLIFSAHRLELLLHELFKTLPLELLLIQVSISVLDQRQRDARAGFELAE